MPDLERRVAVARGDEPADLVIRGGRVFSVFTREWLEGDLAIADGAVAGLGEYEGKETLDASGRYVVPGFIDAHMHLESSKLLVDEFARLVLPLGTTDVFFMASSSVPASVFESPRRPLGPGDLEGLLRRRRVLGLAEMMNFPGVVAGSETELEKLTLPGATHVDGHAPTLLGKELNAYAAAGIRSDHEMSTIEEGRERLRAGMWVLIREASGARNLHALLPLVEEFGPHRLAFCTDDREPEHIAEEGHINSMVRDAVAAGVRPEDALVMASFNPALWHNLRHLGALAPGYQADVLILPDLESFAPETVLKAGREVGEITKPAVPDWVKNSVRIRPLSTNDFTIPWEGDGQARVIGIVPDQIVTESLVDDPLVENGRALADPTRDMLKIAVVERHLGTGRVGLGFVRGFGLRSGALASTVAHDAHNVVDRGIVKAELKLPVAGLLSDAGLEEVIAASRACVEAAHDLGCELASPFQSMAFLALSVIPSLKITDRGLVDVDRFEIVPLEA